MGGRRLQVRKGESGKMVVAEEQVCAQSAGAHTPVGMPRARSASPSPLSFDPFT